jgi:hypothetical protein
MSNDSKLGLLAGVAAVVLIAVVYFQNGAPGTPAKQAQAKPAVVATQAAAITPVEAGGR